MQVIIIILKGDCHDDGISLQTTARILSFSSLFLNSVVPEKFRYSNTLNLQEKTTDGRILVVVDYSSK